MNTEMYFNDVQYLPYYCICGSCNAVNSSVFFLYVDKFKFILFLVKLSFAVEK